MNFWGDDLLRRSEAHAQGFTDGDIRAAIERGELVALRRGVYGRTEVLAELNPTERHRLDTRAAMFGTAAGSAASHQSAAAMHGFGLYGIDLGKVHISTGNTTGGYVRSFISWTAGPRASVSHVAVSIFSNGTSLLQSSR